MRCSAILYCSVRVCIPDSYNSGVGSVEVGQMAKQFESVLACQRDPGHVLSHSVATTDVLIAPRFRQVSYSVRCLVNTGVSIKIVDELVGVVLRHKSARLSGYRRSWP